MKDKTVTRKEFLQTSAGLIGLGLLSAKPQNLHAIESDKIVLGRTGLKVSPICYGASRVMESALVRTALDRGINILDTGRTYAGGQNEIMLGEALKGIRDQVVIQSKLKLHISDDELNKKHTDNKIKKQMERSLTETLQALQSNYVDIMLIHGLSSEKLMFNETVLEFFNQAKKEGKIRASGFSAHNNNMHVLEAAEKNPVYDIIMVPYNYKGSFTHSRAGYFAEWDQQKLEELLTKLHEQQVGIIAMKTCSAGPMSAPESVESSYRNSIQWVLNQSFVDCANVAMTTYDQINENLSG
ncbi:aldo/keto reductase [candidate division KSB1 bacterium]|nr:aldo/keto reductase [candidate division KSB1 bacterium]